MKRLPVVFAIFLFALLFVISMMPGLMHASYQPALWIGSQAGMACSIVLYIILSLRKRR